MIDDGSEFEGILVYMQMDKKRENDAKWNCILEACCSIAILAYEKGAETYLPALLEGMEESDSFEFFNSQVKQIVTHKSQFITEVEYFIEGLSTIDREMILKKIGELSLMFGII